MASDYRCPPAWDKDGNPTKEDTITGWQREAIQHGTNFLKSQRAYPDLDRALDILAGPDDERIPKALSRVHVNRLKRQIRETVATLSNLRPIWAYKNDNKQFDDQALVLNKLVVAWWHNTFADRSIREGLQYAAVEGTGYVSPIWEKDFWVTGRGDIQLYTYGPRDVLPVQLPRNHDLQRAYAVTIRTEVPIAMAHAMYPLFADRIKPDREQASWFRRGLKKVQRFVSPALQVADQDRDREVMAPTVDIFNTYILDLTVNNTGKAIPMGKPGTSWFYVVPFVGMDIPTGIKDTTTGTPLYRKATWEDCLLYPMRRLLVGTNSVRLEDGSSPWWHGKVPIVKFTVDDWPWNFLGFSALRDGASIQAARNRMLRVIDDSANTRLRPPLKYDDTLISPAAMDVFDTRQSNQRIAVNMTMGDPIAPVLPPEYYDVPAWIWQYLSGLNEDLDFVMAHRDMAALARARQLPAADTVEKLFEVLGPIPQDQSRTMERGLRDLGEMIKYLFFQWYTVPRKVQILGANGIVEADYDYDPGNMIPTKNAEEAMEAYFGRVRRHASNFVFHVTPNSLHQITQLGRQMVLLQLYRGGFPLDPWTLAEAMDIPNFGPPPEGTKNVTERWVAWMRMRAEMMAQMQAEAAAMAQASGLAGALESALGGGGKPPGRPPSGHAPPELQVKEGGARTVIAESR